VDAGGRYKNISLKLSIWIFKSVGGVFVFVFSSVSDPDPDLFGSVSFWSAGSGSASMKRIRILVAKNQPKSWKISTKIIRMSYIFFKTIKLMFTDINIYSINNKTDHISEKY